MSKVEFFDCYDYNKGWLLVEMKVDEYSDELDWMEFVVPEAKFDKEDWQVPYLEQYLNDDGTQTICKLYSEPKTPVKPCRFTFFLCKIKEKKLVTPYGEFSLKDPKPVPERLRRIIRFTED